MPAPVEELIDLKFLPAWVKESEPDYAAFAGEEAPPQTRAVPYQERDRTFRRADKRRQRDHRPRANKGRQPDKPRRRAERDRSGAHQPRPRNAPLPLLDVRFVPQANALDNVVTQIKTGTAAYSVYALARLFLQKPERYDVRVTARGETRLFRLAGTNILARDRASLESWAFQLLRDEYYKCDVTLSEPVKGNFTAVARERSSGVLLGPTNHHSYQPALRRLFEQRFSRRMSFPDFQRQIEIVNDRALIERWRDEIRKITTFTTLKEEPPLVFHSEAEVERHFGETYAATLIGETAEAEIDGVTSRTLRDRALARAIENAWTMEMRSPSHMMQELAGRMRGSGLHIFRHRKGMLFVSPIRPQSVDETAVTDSAGAILRAVRAAPRMTRKELADKLIMADLPAEEAEKIKFTLAADLRWLIREGHLVEFNDGSLDLPRTKPQTGAESSAVESVVVNQAETVGSTDSGNSDKNNATASAAGAQTQPCAGDT